MSDHCQDYSGASRGPLRPSGRRTPRPRAGRHRTPGAAGFSVPEMLIALAILAMLLAAIALATHGMMQSYTENVKIAEVTQAARVVLHRIIGQVRSAEAVDSAAQRISIIPPDNDEGISLIVYELVAGELRCSRTINGSPETHVLIPSDGSVQVEDFSISRETETAVDGEGLTYTYTRSLTAILGLRVGDNALEITASACPRRNLEY